DAASIAAARIEPPAESRVRPRHEEPAQQRDADGVADEKREPERDASVDEQRRLHPLPEGDDDRIEHEQDERVLLPGGRRRLLCPRREPRLEAVTDLA